MKEQDIIFRFTFQQKIDGLPLVHQQETFSLMDLTCGAHAPVFSSLEGEGFRLQRADQFTGKIAKNNDKIFNNDPVKFYLRKHSFLTKIIKWISGEAFFGNVQFDEKTLSYKIVAGENMSYPLADVFVSEVLDAQ